MKRTGMIGFAIVIGLLAGTFASAQEEFREPCRQFANGDLYALGRMPVGAFLDTTLELMYWDADGHATTILPPDSGTDSCLYGPERAVDGDPATAWCEGVDGNGEGEILVVHLGNRPESVREIEIWAGFGRSASLHERNGRPRTLRIHVLQAITGLPNQYDTTMRNFVKIGEGEIHLEDVNAYQRVPVPAFDMLANRDERQAILDRFFTDYPEYWLEELYVGPVFIAMEIVDVYPGTSWEDTLISEVRLRE